MGLLDTVVKNIIVVKADTSQAKLAIKDLAGEEKKAAKDRLEQIERENLAIEGQIKSWAKFAAGVGATVGAFKLLAHAADAAVESAKKSGTAGEGAVKAWTDATTRWKTAIDQIMVSFGQLAIKLAPLVDLAAKLLADIGGLDRRDLMNQQERLKDTWAQVSRQLDADPNNKYLQSQEAKLRQQIKDLMAAPALAATQEMLKTFDAQTNKFWTDYWALADRVRLQKESDYRAKLAARKGGTPYFAGFAPDLIGAYQDVSGTISGAASGLVSAAKDVFQNARGFRPLGEATDDSKFRETMKYVREDTAGLADEIARARAAAGENFLEGIFGPIEQFSAYAAAFGILQGAVTAAFDAWITGQSSIGEAVKAAIATGLRAVAIEMGIQALKHTAYGFGALALGPIAGASAAGHFAAAGLFTAGAAAAGIAAHQMYAAGWGGGGGSTSTGGGGGGGGGAPRVSNADSKEGNGQVVVMLGSDFGMLTSLEQKQLLSSAIRLGLNSSRGTKRVRRGS